MDQNAIAKRIRQAYDIAVAADLQEKELFKEAFRFALYAGANRPSVADTSDDNLKNHRQELACDDSIRVSQLRLLAMGLDVAYDVIETFYEISDGELSLNIAAKALPRSTSAAMREVAVLLTVGRKHAGLGAETAYERIRAICDDNARLDARNFAAVMAGLKPRLVITGKGAVRSLVAKKPADDLAREILRRYSATM